MKQDNGFGLVEVIVIVVVLTLIGGGAYLWFSRNATTSVVGPSPTATSSPNPTLTPTTDPTAGWKTYDNSKYSVKYPPAWSVAEVSSTETGIAGDSASFVINRGGLGIGLPPTYEPERYEVYVDGEQIEVREWAESSSTSFLIVFEAARGSESFFFRLGGLDGVNRQLAKTILMTMLSTFQFK